MTRPTLGRVVKRPQVLAPEVGENTLKETRWGGTRLAPLRAGPDALGRPIGESWEFSTLEDQSSRALGRPLQEVLGGPLPFLVKLIDTAQWLSIQVHPQDTETQPGKEEAWVVLEAAPGAQVLAGLRSGTTIEQLAATARVVVEDPRRGHELSSCLEAHPVRTGCVLLVPAGTVHAIGPGILLAEIQQPVDRTFRLFDYGSGRPIHVEQALATIEASARPLVGQPDHPVRELEGKHLRLTMLPVGEHTIDFADTPAVIVPVRGGVSLEHDDGEERLTPGALRLCISGSIRIRVDSGGLAVVGSLRAP